MKQVTGSSTPNNNDKCVSIQLKLGGHSFSNELIAAYTDVESIDVVEFTLLTHKYTLVPSDVFDETLLDRYLELNNLQCSENESAIAIPVADDIIAVCAINRYALNTITKKLGARAKFTSPFTEISNNGDHRDENIYFHIFDGVTYVMVYDSKLRFAEALVASTLADYVYVVECLSDEFPISKYNLLMTGEYDKSLSKAIKSYFKGVVCE